MRIVCVLLVLTAGAGLAQTDDSTWISYYNGADGWFAFQGPQRAMRLNPADFGLSCPLRVESLKTWWYWGMGSRQDTVFTFRIYGGDGRTLLWESESLVAPVTNWTYYDLSSPVMIDSGSFYIATAHRLVNPWAHPYVNVDTGPTNHSYYGSPGAWQLDNVGEFCYFAFVREVRTGVGDGAWVGADPERVPLAFGSGFVRVGAGRCVHLLDAAGRTVSRLGPGLHDLSGRGAGVYFVVRPDGRSGKLLIGR
ncbi:hypothetical protein FJY71_06435 [candidate division WOR-3 bacterium]|nr:hypothetical protein [candidate division WOR-3 bacterium]